VAHATDRAPPDQAARVVAGLLFVWSAGAVLGPAMAGAFFDTPWGGHALFGFAVVGALALIISMLWRRSAHSETGENEKTPFVPAPASPSVAMAEMVGDSAEAPQTGKSD
jgi:MFS family permease